MSDTSIQSCFLEKVRKSLPSNISFVDELAENLSISRDSAYRRIRGETVLSLDEVSQICKRFKMSLDEIILPPLRLFHFITGLLQKWISPLSDYR